MAVNILMIGIIVIITYIVTLSVMKSKRGRCRSDASLEGKTVIITGASRGIGYQAALNLAGRRARVILAQRGGAQSDNAVKKIQQLTGNSDIRHVELDLSSLESVRRFSEVIHREESRLDILINNAGISAHPKKMTKDGLEINMATNYFGPFLLTNLLLDLLKKSAPSRIIVTSSIAHKWGSINFDNLNAEKSFSVGTVYFDTKLAGVMFTRELSRCLENTGVTVNALHPGSVHTDLLEKLPGPVYYIVMFISYLFFRSPEEGSQTTLHLAVSPEVEGVTGKYFSECRQDMPSHKAMDDALARKLWEVSEKLTGLA